MENSAHQKSDLLIQEYQRAVQHMEQQFTHILQILSIGFTALGAVIVLMSTRDGETQIMEWGYWGIPFVLDLLVAIVVYLLLQIVFAGYYVRDIEDELSGEYDIPYLHFQGTVARGIFSFRTGITEMKGVLIVLLAIVAAVYCSLIISCIVGLSNLDVPFWRLLAFTVLQVAITGALVWLGVGSTKSFKHVYRRWIKLDSTKSDELAKRYGGGPAAKTWIRYIIVPKPIDLVMKPLLTLAAAGLAMLGLRIHPSWNLLIAVVLATICLEFLAKQATYIWNEILDMDKERLHPWKKQERFLLLLDDGPIGRKVGKFLFLSRATLAIVMAVAIGDLWGLTLRGVPWFVVLIAFVFAWQLLYERWGKSDPRRRLLMVGLGYAERTIVGAGVVMAVASDWDPWLLFLVTAWVCILQTMIIANLWCAESEFLSADSDEGPHPSDQSPGWFVLRNNRIQVLTAAALLFVGLVLAIRLVAGSIASSISSHELILLGCTAIGLVFIAGSYLFLTHERAANTPIPINRRFQVLALAIVLGILIWIAVAWSATPLLACGIVVAMAIPVGLVTFSAGSTYDELNAFGRMINQADKILPWLDRTLFASHSIEERESAS